MTFEVAQVWKGSVQDTTVVRIGNGGDCGYMFIEQQAYIVYTYGNGNDLWTAICGRTAPMADARVDVETLGQGMQPQDPATATSIPFVLLLVAVAAILMIVPFAVLRTKNRTQSSL